MQRFVLRQCSVSRRDGEEPVLNGKPPGLSRPRRTRGRRERRPKEGGGAAEESTDGTPDAPHGGAEGVHADFISARALPS